MQRKKNSLVILGQNIMVAKVLALMFVAAIVGALPPSLQAQKPTLGIQNQQLTITGQVKDETGETLPGVSVWVKGSKTTTVADDEGKYTITVPKNAILLFSFIGYQSEERTVGTNKTINVVLKTNSSLLDEVLVVGYGTVKKQDLTGSVGQVSVQDLQKAPVMSFEQALAGRIAGVDVSSNDGQPGQEGINIVIRGNNSLTQDNSPLYVIDGFPMEGPENAAINPEEIESITVLKDASATAIYGARGANGVIVIETKKGKSGVTSITYNTSLGFQKVTKTMELLTPYDFIKYQLEVNPVGTANRYFTKGKTIDSYIGVKGFDWQDQILQTATNQIHNLALRGGNDRTKFSLSASLNDMKGVIINSGQSRSQARFVLDHNISNKFQAGINLNYSIIKDYGQISSSGGSASSSYMYSVWGYRPITGTSLDEDDDPEDLTVEIIDNEVNGSIDTRVNPILSAKNEIRKRRGISMALNSYASYQLTPALTLRVSGGYNSLIRRNDAFYNSLTSRGTPLLPRNIRGVNGSVGYTESTTWLNENTLTYKKNINKKDRFEALVGFTLQGSEREGYGYSSQLIANEVLGMSGLDTGTPYTSSAYFSDNTLMSFLGRANYSIKSKYLFTASFRADGSSKFPAENRWGYFPSGAFAWRIKNEDFMKNIKVVSDAKLRVSYGLTGNNRVTDFAPIPALGQSYSYYYSFNNGTPTSGITPINMGNSKLKWETTEQADLGLDVAFFRKRVELTVDVYRKTTRDLLFNADMPYVTGFSSIFRNIGKIRNEGLELTLNTNNIDARSFKWQSSINISFNKNKILELVDDQQNRLSTMSWENAWNNTPLYIAEVGGPAAMFFGLIWDGVYQTTDFENGVLKPEIAYHGTDRGAIKAGHIKYRDLNGDGVITAADQTIIGRTLPIHSGGFSNNFSYKGIELGVFFQWKYGNDIYNANRIVFEGNSLARTSLNQFASVLDRWTPQNQTSNIPSFDGRGPGGFYSSRQLEDGSFIRLKTVQLSYSLPKKWVKIINLNSLGVNVAAQNLYTWTKYSGMDPEVGVRNTTLTPGFDFSAYPRAKTIVFGLKASF